MLELFWILAQRWGCSALEAQHTLVDAILEALLIQILNGGSI